MTQGFLQTGKFEPVFSNDFNHAAIQSYRANFDPNNNHSSEGDIRQIIGSTSAKNIPKSDVVIGGPPCQGFSLLNRNRINDPRNELWSQFIEAARIAKAKVLVMENVPQLLSSAEFEEICLYLNHYGFKHIESSILIAADYGTPQVRKRAIIMASKQAPISLPRPTHCNPKLLEQEPLSLANDWNLKPWRDVRSAIADLPPPIGTSIRDVEPPLDLHFGRNPTPKSIERYEAVPLGGNRFDLQKNRPDITPDCWKRKTKGGTDLFGRLWWDRPSVTIRTEFFKPEKGRYLHPDQNRPITHREAARIQGFPDSFVFRGSKTEIARQIGNAIPPPLAKAIAKEVVRCLAGQTEKSYVAETSKGIKYLGKLRS